MSAFASDASNLSAVWAQYGGTMVRYKCITLCAEHLYPTRTEARIQYTHFKVVQRGEVVVVGRIFFGNEGELEQNDAGDCVHVTETK